MKKLKSVYKNIVFFTPKIVKSSQKYRFVIRDPGSGKNLFRIRIRNTVGLELMEIV